MAELDIDVRSLPTKLADPDFVSSNAFAILRSLCRLTGDEKKQELLQSMVLRLLPHRQRLEHVGPMLDSLIREVGLFPFLDQESLGLADAIAYEYHKPEDMPNPDVVFHRPQASVYRELLSGQSVALSAPTSFGKSLIIDAIVASNKHSNILIIVPTIALIDETRRRLSVFKHKYKLITHPLQVPAQRNVFILTQERALEITDLESIDFFVLDEFYKLAPGRDDESRAALLNHIFYKLIKLRKPFYMLGPSVEGLTAGLATEINCTFRLEKYPTVASELHPVRRTGDDLQTLADLCKKIGGPTLIFCSSPNKAAEVAQKLSQAGLGRRKETLHKAIDWLSREFHPDWHVVQSLKNGIGIHHGRIPRSIGYYMIKAFDEELIDFLVCTSTLIEGVNTKAQNVIIFDEKINRERYDYFTFNNICGRSGRMFKHFVGHVYLFHEPPHRQLPVVDIPVVTQPSSTPTSLLLQLDDSDLSQASLARLAPYRQQDALSFETLQANVGVDPDGQVALARTLHKNLSAYHKKLYWSGNKPTWEQQVAVAELIWDHFNGSKLAGAHVRTSRQLATLVNKLRQTRSTRQLINDHISFSQDKDPDAAVTAVLDFTRKWAMFHYPKLLRALDQIQKDVFNQHRLPSGDYSVFATLVENLFVESVLVALDEYGVPLEVARKIKQYLRPLDDLDSVLQKLRTINLGSLRLHEFEIELLTDAQRHL